MINVTIGESKTQSEKPFPKLMISELGTIVLMSSHCCGTVVHERSMCYGIGHSSSGWQMRSFTDYNEPITLQNA